MRALIGVVAAAVLIMVQAAVSQTLTFTLKNPQVISGTVYQYEVWIRSSDGTSRMGSIQVYNHYSTVAFGSSIVQNGKVTTTKGSAFGLSYLANLNNDNTGSVFSYSWTYAGGPGNGVVVPSTGDGVLAYTVQIQLANASATSGITFDAGLMSEQQYFDDETNFWPTLDVTSTLDAPLPVELVRFVVAVKGSATELTWQTATEKNNYGFQVQRQRVGEQSFTDVSAGFIGGHGTTNVPQIYTFTDQNAGAVSWSYRLKQIDLDGAIHYYTPTGSNSTTMEVQPIEKPKEFNLAQNYPNPFNPTTRIQYSLPENTHVLLEVFNILGQRIAILIDGSQPAGYYDRTFDASGLPSGIYFYRLTTPSASFLKKMTLLK